MKISTYSDFISQRCTPLPPPPSLSPTLVLRFKRTYNLEIFSPPGARTRDDDRARNHLGLGARGKVSRRIFRLRDFEIHRAIVSTNYSELSRSRNAIRSRYPTLIRDTHRAWNIREKQNIRARASRAWRAKKRKLATRKNIRKSCIERMILFLFG